MDEVVVKRGRGRPRGSLSKPKPPALSPEEAAAVKQRLAGAYAEAAIAYAVAADRMRRIKVNIRRNFGNSGFQEVEEFIQAAEERLVPNIPSDAGIGERADG